ncbi:hypothetical protein FQR65_LT20992 [Abscondita terminalis]|nr:hypothetical protein FQR65_LT20992 [Abscondita terminalis]
MKDSAHCKPVTKNHALHVLVLLHLAESTSGNYFEMNGAGAAKRPFIASAFQAKRRAKPIPIPRFRHVHRYASATPKVGFYPGLPKALVDSERILTQLRMEGYGSFPPTRIADVAEAIKENGKVIVTGCMGVEEGNIRQVHPSVLAVTGPQQYEQVVSAVHEVVPPKQDHNPLIDLVPPQGHTS